MADDDFRSLVVGILARHFGGIDETSIEERPSSAGRYLGITVTVRAQNKAQIDAAYMDFTSCQRLLVALGPLPCGLRPAERGAGESREIPIEHCIEDLCALCRHAIRSGATALQYWYAEVFAVAILKVRDRTVQHP